MRKGRTEVRPFLIKIFPYLVLTETTLLQLSPLAL